MSDGNTPEIIDLSPSEYSIDGVPADKLENGPNFSTSTSKKVLETLKETYYGLGNSEVKKMALLSSIVGGIFAGGAVFGPLGAIATGASEVAITLGLSSAIKRFERNDKQQ